MEARAHEGVNIAMIGVRDSPTLGTQPGWKVHSNSDVPINKEFDLVRVVVEFVLRKFET
jgi:hypothetical protein